MLSDDKAYWYNITLYFQLNMTKTLTLVQFNTILAKHYTNIFTSYVLRLNKGGSRFN